MSTTTIRLEAKLKARLSAAATRHGKSPHAFILEAIAQHVEQDEIDAAFLHLAEERLTRIASTGKTVPWSEVKTWLEAESRGETPKNPAGLSKQG